MEILIAVDSLGLNKKRDIETVFVNLFYGYSNTFDFYHPY